MIFEKYIKEKFRSKDDVSLPLAGKAPMGYIFANSREEAEERLLKEAQSCGLKESVYEVRFNLKMLGDE